MTWVTIGNTQVEIDTRPETGEMYETGWYRRTDGRLSDGRWPEWKFHEGKLITRYRIGYGPGCIEQPEETEVTL